MSPVRSTASPLDLLRQLGSGVRPDGATRAASSPAPGVESASFDELLALARSGGIEPGAPLTFARDVRNTLSDEALAALAVATDAAEAQGVTRLAAQVGGRVVTVDVARREIVAIDPARANAIVTGVDAFVALDAGADAPGEASGDSGASGPRLALPGTLTQNESLAQALSRPAQHRAG